MRCKLSFAFAFNKRCDYNPRICQEQTIVQYVCVFVRLREIEEQMNLRRALKELQEQRSNVCMIIVPNYEGMHAVQRVGTIAEYF